MKMPFLEDSSCCSDRIDLKRLKERSWVERSDSIMDLDYLKQAILMGDSCFFDSRGKGMGEKGGEEKSGEKM